jgi:hypothetical protein
MQAGVTVEVLQATDTEDGVLAPGLQITRQQEFPGGTLNVTYTLGRTLAAARAGALPASVDLGLGGAPEVSSGDGASADPGAPSLAQASATEAASLSEAASSFAGDAGLDSGGSALGFSGSAPGSDAAASPADSSAAVAAPSAGSTPEGAELASSQPAAGPKSPVSGWSLFPMLLLAGGLLAAAPLSRRLTF